MKRVLVTGAAGFIGRAACRQFAAAGLNVRRALRRPEPAGPSADDVVVGDIDLATSWAAAFDGVSHVLHLANRAHRVDEDAADPMAEYRRVNVDGTRNLADQAAAAGISRFVYVSSIKVNGESSPLDRPFTPSDEPNASDRYGISKVEAESAVRHVGAETGMETVIVRPPLVYGPGVGANFLRLLRAVDRRYPLPLGRVDNARSMIYLGNLVDLLHRCLEHPAAAGNTFLASDGPPLSTPELIRQVAAALARMPMLLPMPLPLLRAAGRVTGRRAAVDRLLGSLVVDDSATRGTLGWSPPFTAAQGLRQTALWYRKAARTPD